MEKIITNKASETQEKGYLLAQEVLKVENNERAVIILLEGELGAGKTTFLQGFAKGLGIKKRIQSPTFIIMNHFKTIHNKFKDYYHFDCYRLNSEDDLEIFNFPEIYSNPQNIICLEWASNIQKAIPSQVIKIKIIIKNDGGRDIKIKGMDYYGKK